MIIIIALFILFDVVAYIHLSKKYNLKWYDLFGVWKAWIKEFGVF